MDICLNCLGKIILTNIHNICFFWVSIIVFYNISTFPWAENLFHSDCHYDQFCRYLECWCIELTVYYPLLYNKLIIAKQAKSFVHQQHTSFQQLLKRIPLNPCYLVHWMYMEHDDVTYFLQATITDQPSSCDVIHERWQTSAKMWFQQMFQILNDTG